MINRIHAEVNKARSNWEEGGSVEEELGNIDNLAKILVTQIEAQQDEVDQIKGAVRKTIQVLSDSHMNKTDLLTALLGLSRVVGGLEDDEG